MNGAIAWFANNRVAANLLMWLLVIGGLLVMSGIPQHESPEPDPDVIIVQVEYRGASPEEMESSVCVRIEEAVDGLEGLDRLMSTSREGLCSVTVILLAGSDLQEALDDVKRRVDAIDTFPDEAESPSVAQVDAQRDAMQLAVHGKADARTLKTAGERVRDALARLPGVKSVDLGGARKDEISIELSEAALRRYGLSFDAVAAAVRQSSLEMPGGSLRTSAGEIALRTSNEARRGEEFEELVVLTRPDGTRLNLRNVARVADGFEDAERHMRFDGEPAVNLRVFRGDSADNLAVSATVHAHLDSLRGLLPDGLSLTVWQDGADSVRARTGLMLHNGRAGLALVLLLLALFLRPRVALWVAAGMPISMLGAIFLFRAFDLSFHQDSMLAFIVVLGILVDDAIVVGESVYTRQEAGDSPIEAAVKGAQAVAIPVVFGVLTTACAFMPFLLITGPMSDSAGPLGTVVLLCLFFSVIESQWVLPAHLGHGRARERREARTTLGGRWLQLQERAAGGLRALANGPYLRLLERAMQWRYVTLAAALAVFAVAVSLPASGRLSFAVFPALQADSVTAKITLPQGVPIEATERAVAQVARAGRALVADLEADPATAGAVLHFASAVGGQPFGRGGGPESLFGGDGASGGSHLGEVSLQLTPADERDFSALEIAKRWRQSTAAVPGVEELRFESAYVSFGAPVDIALSHDDLDVLVEAAEQLKQRLHEYPGLYDIADTQRAGKEELRLAITPSGETLGLTLHDIARQVRQAFHGEEVQRIQRGRDDVRVLVRYPESERSSLYQLDALRIRAADGVEVPFRTVARVEHDRAPVSIKRAQRRRVIQVRAEVDRARTSEGQVLADLRAEALPALMAAHPGLAWNFEGAQRVGMQAAGDLTRLSIVALFGIYALLAVPLRSYAQPLLIMAVIPFGLAGALYGHALMALFREGFGLTMLSFLGAIALTGVVVNSSLVLVHNVNLRLRQGMPLRRAVTDAALARFRPIVLTSATTFAGLSPLLFDTATEAQFFLPIATSLAFGIVFATVVSLLVLPCLYLVGRDLGALVGVATRTLQPIPAPPPEVGERAS